MHSHSSDLDGAFGTEESPFDLDTIAICKVTIAAKGVFRK
jgi:hypothetical protein